MDKKISIDAPALPMATVVVGTVVKGRPNFMPAGWISMADMSPPQLSVSVAKGRHTTEGMPETGAFSVNPVTAEMAEKADCCGLISGRNVYKSEVFKTFEGELEKAPPIRDSPTATERLVARTVELPTHYLFAGEVNGACAGETFLQDGKVDVTGMRPLLLTMPDNRYRALGETTAEAWSVGQRLKVVGRG